MAYSKTVKGLTIQIGGDTSGFSKAISDVNKQLKQATSSINQLNKDIKLDPSNTDLMADRMTEYGKAIDAAREKVKTLQAALEQGTSQGLLDERDVQDLNEQIHRTQSQIKQLEGTYDDLKANGGQAAQDLTTSQKDLTKAVDSTADAADNAAEHLSKMYDLDQVADTMTSKITEPLVNAGKEAISTASDFESSLATISTLGVDADQVEKIKQQVKDASKETGESLTNITNSVYSAISGGRDASEAVDFVTNSIKTAKAGLADTEDVTKVIDSVLNTYGEDAGTAEQISDKLIMTQNKGVTTVAELAQSLGDIIPTANATGVSFNDLMSATATLTKGGLATNKAVTGLKAALSNIIKPTDDAIKAADALGISFDAKTLKEKGIEGFFKDIQKAMEDASPEYAKVAKQAQAYNDQISANTSKREKDLKSVEQLTAANKDLKKQMDGLINPKTGKHDTSSDTYKQLKEQYTANREQITAYNKEARELKSANTQLNKGLKGTQETMTTLANATNSPIQAYATLFGSVEGLNAVMSLTSESGMKDMDTISQQMAESAGTLSDAYADVEDTTAARMEKLQAQLDVLKADLGEELLPYIVQFAKEGSKVLKWVDALPEGVKKIGIEAGVAVAAVGPLLKVISTLSKIKNLTGIGKSLKGLTSLKGAASVTSSTKGAASVMQTIQGGTSQVASTGSALAGVGTKFLSMSSYVGVAAEIGLVIKEYAHVMEDISNLKIGKNWQTNLKAVSAFAAEGAAVAAALTAAGGITSKLGGTKDAAVGEALAAGLEAQVGGIAAIIKAYASLIQQISDIEIADDYEANLDKVKGMMTGASVAVGILTGGLSALTALTGGTGALVVGASELLSAGILAEMDATAKIISHYADVVQQIGSLSIDDATFDANMQRVKDTIADLTATMTSSGLVDFFTMPAQIAGQITTSANVQAVRDIIDVTNQLTTLKVPGAEQIAAFKQSMTMIQGLFADDEYHFGDVTRSFFAAFADTGETIDLTQTKLQFDMMLDMINKLAGLEKGIDGAQLKTQWGSVLSVMADDTSTYMQQITATMTTELDKIKDLFKSTQLEFSHDIALPHLKAAVDAWNGNPGQTLPTFSVDWYAKGGIFTSPSVIGVGEAGSEAVVPIDKLQSMLAKSQQQSTAQIVAVLTQILDAQGTSIVLDSGQLVGGIVGKMDKALGQQSARARRQ